MFSSEGSRRGLVRWLGGDDEDMDRCMMEGLERPIVYRSNQLALLLFTESKDVNNGGRAE